MLLLHLLQDHYLFQLNHDLSLLLHHHHRQCSVKLLDYLLVYNYHLENLVPEIQEVDFLMLQLKKEQEFLIYHHRQILHKNLFLELRSFYHYHHLPMLYLILMNMNL